MNELTFEIAAGFGIAVGLLSYFFYWKKSGATIPKTIAAISGGIVAVIVIIIGIITE